MKNSSKSAMDMVQQSLLINKNKKAAEKDLTLKLFDALKQYQHDRVAELIKAGADINAKNGEGWTAPMVAAQR